MPRADDPDDILHPDCTRLAQAFALLDLSYAWMEHYKVSIKKDWTKRGDCDAEWQGFTTGP
jgi:hypothetical protein